MRILICPLIHIPWKNFLLQLILWLRALAAEVLAGLLPPLLPCYIPGFSLSGVFFLAFLLLMVFSVGLIWRWHVCWVFCLLFIVMSASHSFRGVFYSFCSCSLPVVMCFYKTPLERLFPWSVSHSMSSHGRELLSVVDNTEGINGDTEPQLVKDCRQTVNVLWSHREKDENITLRLGSCSSLQWFIFLVLCLLLIFNACHKVIATKRMARKVTAAFLWFLFYLFVRHVDVWELSPKYYVNPMGGEWVGGGKKLLCYQ